MRGSRAIHEVARYATANPTAMITANIPPSRTDATCPPSARFGITEMIAASSPIPTPTISTSPLSISTNFCSVPVVKPVATAAVTGSRRVEWVEAPPTADFASTVRLERAKAQRAGRMLVVYVGADWCAPCKAFHEAVLAGQVDDTLGKITFLVFDFDRDASKMGAFGYQTTHIPYFVKPAPDGSVEAAFNVKTMNKPAAVKEATDKLVAWLAAK